MPGAVLLSACRFEAGATLDEVSGMPFGKVTAIKSNGTNVTVLGGQLTRGTHDLGDLSETAIELGDQAGPHLLLNPVSPVTYFAKEGHEYDADADVEALTPVDAEDGVRIFGMFAHDGFLNNPSSKLSYIRFYCPEEDSVYRS